MNKLKTICEYFVMHNRKKGVYENVSLGFLLTFPWNMVK